MKRLQHIAFGIIGGVAGWLLSEWIDLLIDPFWLSLTGAVFTGLGPAALLLWLGLRSHKFSQMVRKEGRFPPPGWEERYGTPTYEVGAVEMKAREAALAAKVFLVMGGAWLVGAAYVAFRA